MAYPQTSEWNSGSPNSAWYAQTVSGGSKVCQTSGWDFLRDLQERLKERLQDSGPLPTLGGQSITAQAVGVNDPQGPISGWDRTLLSALYAVAAKDRAPSVFLQSIVSDAASDRISVPTLQTAIWVNYLNEGLVGSRSVFGVGNPNEAQLPVDLQLPLFGRSPSRPLSTVAVSGLDCHLIPGRPVTPSGSGSWIQNPWVVMVMVAVGALGVIVVSRRIPRIPT